MKKVEPDHSSFAPVGRCYASKAGGGLDEKPSIEGDAAFAGAESDVGRAGFEVRE